MANPLKLNTYAASQQAQSGSSTDTPPSPFTKSIDDRFLTCPICYEMYSQPRCLPCLHSYCHHCLDSYIRSQEPSQMRRKKGFPCPMCKQFHFVKKWVKPLDEWVEEFQKNFLIQNMIDCLHPKTKPNTPTPLAGIRPSVEAVQPYTPTVPQRPSPSAPPLSEYDPPTEQGSYSSPFGQSNSSSGYLAHQGEGLRPSTSVFDVSALHTVSGNPMNARSSSSNDLTRGEEPVLYVDAFTMLRVDTYTRLYDNSSFSDVCFLPKAKTIVLTDYNNNSVVLFSSYFIGNRDSTKVKVKGRPCSVALLNETEDCIVVNLQHKCQIFFISIPGLSILKVLKTQRNYESVSMSAPNTLLTGTSAEPARIDQIEIEHVFLDVLSHKFLVTKDRLCRTILRPNHICALTEDTFVVSDSAKKSLIGFHIETEYGTKVGKKFFSLAPTRDRKFRSLGGMCCNVGAGSFYVVDYGGNAVYQIFPGDTIICEKVLCQSHGIKKPSSVCLGPNGALCVVDWEGGISLFRQRPRETSA
ncbi:uncharacterized protein LOC124276633 [Haliotis rubra]|uniref:uncharacterized protein LOC124276633 n=1 Tax=Haliotis rubra TaxID=36100 RepID=UPI001EE57B99|nr:uncharacterized protein LOC124276633 [Haliotis rubra]XP_046568252.1 uncharacterized protein LOC124276633 [Haliotis rubra]